MTANTPEDSGQPSTGETTTDGKRKKKKASAASSSRDEVTVNTGDGEGGTRWDTDGDGSSGSGRTSAMDAPTPASSGFSESSSRGGGTAQPYAGSLEPASREIGRAAGRKPPRKAHLQVARFEPWSVMKFSFIMSLVSFLVLFIAVAALYGILSVLGVFDALSGTIRDLTSNDQGRSGAVNPGNWFSAARVLGYTALIGTLNVLFITALATVWSVIYNMAADLVGGVEVTLKEADQ
jgi:Transmembrane domain of unknown function (DUF3566)